MKTRTWLLIFGTLALVCAAALFLLRPAQAAQAQIRSDGKLIASVGNNLVYIHICLCAAAGLPN